VNNTIINVICKFTLCFVVLGCFLSCGLESISFLDNIPEGSYRDTGTTIRLPNYQEFFNYFVIYYRIYISGQSPGGIIDTDTKMDLINTMLKTDYNTLERYTNTTTTTVYPITQDTFFNRGYYKLELEDAVINNVLGSGSLGSVLDIRFSPSPGENPVLLINGNQYILQRANSSPDNRIGFNPKPDRRFFNSSELRDYSLAINQLQNSTSNNADVYGRTEITPFYTFVSMYIVAQGTSLDMPPQTIFSQPTFLGIFQLANAN
jgi:hypothetical protein